MRHLAALAVEDDLLARVVGALAADLREEGGEVAKRAMTNASPRSPAVTTPSGEILALLSLLLRNSASEVTSRSWPSAYFARTTICCCSPLPSSTAVLGYSSTLTGLAKVASLGAFASIQRTRSL